ncbi:MAG: TlpA family protein disulfide reductase [Lentisphaeria bacterium]|nr:TlpA family protein disulfide reductase [Lentisphaeria bacterium]NQZ69914.1 TlpA family protein disulfide reductase [Lentisphaeria bacterium]
MEKKSKKDLFIRVVLLIGVFVVAFYLLGKPKKPHPLLNKDAPLISGRLITGENWGLSQVAQKFLIIDFWASWCPPCKADFPIFKALYERYKDNDKVAFLSISIDAKKKALLAYLKSNSFDWPLIHDPEQRIATPYGVKTIPSYWIISPDRKIIRAGINRAARLSKAVDQVLSEAN